VNTISNRKNALPLIVCIILGLVSELWATDIVTSDTLSDISHVTIVYNRDNPPLKYLDEDGEAAGILMDLWRLCAEKTGLEVSFKDASWADTLELVRNGEADIHAGIFYTEERDVFFDYALPILELRYYVFVHKTILGSRRLEDLMAFRIGVPEGFTHEFVQEAVPEATLAVYPDYPTLYVAAERGDIKVFVSPDLNLQYHLTLHGLSNNYRYNPAAPVYRRAYHGAVREGNSALLQKINTGLGLITSEERAEIERKWLGTALVRPDEETLMIAIDSFYQPLTFLDFEGKPSGLIVDLWHLWAEEIGNKVAFLPVDTGAEMAALRSGEADIAACAKESEPDETGFIETLPYYTISSALFVPVDTGTMHAKEEFAGKKIGLVRGEVPKEAVLELLPGSMLVEFETMDDMIQAMLTGETDAFLHEVTTARVLLNNLKLNRKFEEVSDFMLKSPLSAYVKMEDNILAEKIDRGFESIPLPELARIERTWIADESLRFFEQKMASKPLELTQAERAWLRQHPVIKVAATKDWPPFEFVDRNGEYRGISADVLRKVAEKAGFEIEPQTAEWALLNAMLKNKELDLCPGLKESPERRKFLLFTQPFIHFPHTLITREGETDINDLEDLAGKRVPVEEDYFIHEYLETNYPEIELILVPGALQALMEVSAGTADAYVGNVAVASYLISENVITNLEMKGYVDIQEMELSIGVRNDYPELVNILKKGLASLTEKEKREIVEEYIELEPVEKFTLTDEEKEWLEQHKEIRLGVDPEWSPFEFFSAARVYQGISSDYVRLINERLDINMQPEKDLTWAEVILRAKTRKIDVLPCVAKTEERIEFLNFTKPYLSFPMVIVTREKAPFVNSVMDFDAGRVAVVRAHVTQELLERDYPDQTFQLVDTVESGLLAVSRDKADAFVGNLASISYTVDKLGITNLKVATVTPYHFELSFGIRKDWPELIPILDKVLASIPEERKTAIQNSWVNVRFERKIDWGAVVRVSLIVFVVAGIIVGFLVHVNRRLGREVTERKRAQHELRIARDQAESANRAKSAFLATMSHEIRTPMNAIINMAALTMESDLDSKQRQYLNVINSSSRSLLGLINDILDFSKIEAGKMDIESAPFRIREMLEEVTMTFRDRVIEKHVELIVFVALDVPYMVVGDQLRLRQILVNLIGNAFKFTEQGEIVLYVSLTEPGDIDFTLNDNQVAIQFSVKDTGIGIPEEKQELLFEAFTQVDDSTSRKYGGTGLGLAICQRLVRLMGGSGLTLESEYGKGSEFSFVIPLEVSEKDNKPLMVIPPGVSDLRILAVEDNATSRELLETLLDTFGIAHTGVATADEALKLLHTHNGFDGGAVSAPFNVVLMDWQMPGMDGLTATQKIRSDSATRDLPIILISAYAGEQEILRGEKIGVNTFLHKPITPSSLYDSILEVTQLQDVHARRKKTIIADKEDFRGVKILLAEDNEANRFVAQEILRRAGFVLDFAENGREALDKARSKQYDAILMDVQMPEMDGLEATRELRKFENTTEKHRHVPVIAMTANVLKGDDEKCFAAGMDDYVGKPIDRTALFRTLRKWIPKEVRQAAVERYSERPEEAFEYESRGEGAVGFSLPEITGVDVSRGVKRLGLPPEVFLKMLLRFAEGQRETLDNLQEAVEGNDFDEARLHAHSLAGAAGNVGAVALHGLCKNLEHAAKIKDTTIKDLFVELQREATKVFTSIENALGEQKEHETSKISDEDIDEDALARLFHDLEKPLQALDFAAISTVMERIKETGIPVRIQSDFNDLERMIEKYDYESAVQRLELIQQNLGR